MAVIYQECSVDAPADQVWDAVCDVGAVHTRLAANFVVDATLEQGARVVTFANGLVVCELNVGVNDARRRLPCASVGL